MKNLILLLLLLISTAACWRWIDYAKDLPEGFTMKRLRDGYALAFHEAQTWSPQAYLESVSAKYRLENGEWTLQSGRYVFVDENRMEYISIYIDLREKILEVRGPDQVGGKGSLVTTTRFYLANNPLDERHAIEKALAHLPKECKVRELIVLGHSDFKQVWHVDFMNPNRGLFSGPLFLPTISVNAVTGKVTLSSDWNERDWCRPSAQDGFRCDPCAIEDGELGAKAPPAATLAASRAKAQGERSQPFLTRRGEGGRWRNERGGAPSAPPRSFRGRRLLPNRGPPHPSVRKARW